MIDYVINESISWLQGQLNSIAPGPDSYFGAQQGIHALVYYSIMNIKVFVEKLGYVYITYNILEILLYSCRDNWISDHQPALVTACRLVCKDAIYVDVFESSNYFIHGFTILSL